MSESSTPTCRYVIPEIDHPIDHLVTSNNRVADLREWMIARIPCVPSNHETISQLYGMSFNKLARLYINWIDRFISTHPRTPMAWNGFWSRNNPRRYADELNAIIEKIRNGADLRPYLSNKVDTHGFVPRSEIRRGVNWEDKDMALNAYDVHHMHLLPADGKGKRGGDSKELLYVGVTRKEVLLLMLGDHKSFDDGTLAQAVAEHRVEARHTLNGVVGLHREISAKESQKMVRQGISSAQMFGNKAVVPALISMAGTSPHHTMHVDRCCATIEATEKVIEDRSQLLEYFQINDAQLSDDPDWAWTFSHADLCLLDRKSSIAFAICRWWR